jgi:hypothetical protein
MDGGCPMKNVVILCCILITFNFATGNSRVTEFAAQIKVKNYDKAITQLFKNSPLAQKISDGSQQKIELITQLHQAVQTYGNLVSLNFIVEQKEASLKRQVYLLNFEKSVLKMDAIFYAPGKVEFLVEYSLDDNLLQALREIQSLKAK